MLAGLFLLCFGSTSSGSAARSYEMAHKPRIGVRCRARAGYVPVCYDDETVQKARKHRLLTSSVAKCMRECEKDNTCVVGSWKRTDAMNPTNGTCNLRPLPCRLEQGGTDELRLGTMGFECDDAASWVVMLTVNLAYIQFFRNWYLHFVKLQIPVPVIVIAEDTGALKELKAFNDANIIVSAEKEDIGLGGDDHTFGSAGFGKLMARRPDQMLTVLKHGRNIVYTDTDAIWTRNPFPFFLQHLDVTAPRDTDYHYGLSPYVCAGFLAARSNHRTIELFEEWRRRLLAKPGPNQYVYNQVLLGYGPKLGVTHSQLPRHEFPSGMLFFEGKHETNATRKVDPIDHARAVVVHNNWIQGRSLKIKRFRAHNLWLVNSGTGVKKKEEM